MLALLQVSSGAYADAIKYIDTHVHLESRGGLIKFPEAARNAVETMAQKGISYSILMPPPMLHSVRSPYDIDLLLPLVKEHSNRFGVMGGGLVLNGILHSKPAEKITATDRAEFRAKAEQLLAKGAIGFGEITIVHFSLSMMGGGHPYEEIPADHPLLILLADIAAENDVPIDVHLDVSPEDRPLPAGLPSTNPALLKENLAAFERLLTHNTKAKIVWSHAGSDPGMMRTPALMRRLLAKHPNLYMSLRAARPDPNPATAWRQLGVLKEGWLALIRDFPDRFILGSDQFHPASEDDRRTPSLGLDFLQKMVNNLPPDLAPKVAYENAKRIYKLP
jgi:predicted TIM-barrel fold metal-dependent hydrolase